MPLPELLVSHAERAVELLQEAGQLEASEPFQAAICNLYHAARRPSDRLGGHRDDVEEDTRSPLVTLSLGLPCVFLLGKDTRAAPPLPLLLPGGAVLVLAGRARQAFHGVPCVLVPPSLQLKGRSPKRQKMQATPRLAWVYQPWLDARQAAEGDWEKERDAIRYLLTRARVSFSIRSVCSDSEQERADRSERVSDKIQRSDG
ncbi:unnamed protein product [Effrenium voratum]|nr:unnamed protein product [Effrenium voratum]